jgi:hypothetical protein
MPFAEARSKDCLFGPLGRRGERIGGEQRVGRTAGAAWTRVSLSPLLGAAQHLPAHLAGPLEGAPTPMVWNRLIPGYEYRANGQ